MESNILLAIFFRLNQKILAVAEGAKTTHPLKTPRTRFNTKNEPRMMSDTK